MSYPRTTWLADMRRANVLAVAAALGCKTTPPRNSDGGAIYGCPQCGADRRHTKSGDRRGAIGVRRDGAGWRCFQCDQSGDAVDAVALSRHGKRFRELGHDGKGAVRRWCLEWLGSSISGSLAHHEQPLSEPSRPQPRTSSPVYVPEEQLEALWCRAKSIERSVSVETWCAAKRLDVQSIVAADLARALVRRDQLPRWAAAGRLNWFESGHLLVLPLFDARGERRGMLARRVEGSGNPKSCAARGFARSGLVLACSLARTVLRTGEVPTWWTGAPLRIEVCEGEKKFLMRATTKSDANEYAPAVIGVESGSWTESIAERLPDGVEVFVATDPDDTGARYATTILRSLVERIISGAISVELRDGLVMLSERSYEVRVEVAGQCPIDNT